MSYEAILFDFDGVLVDSEPVHWQCWNEILAPFGGSLDWDTYANHCIGVSDREMIHALCRNSTPNLPFDDIWAEYPRKRDLFRQRMSATDPISEDVRTLITELKGNYLLAVVTSSGQREVEPLLEIACIRSLLDAAVFGGDVVRLKPAPDPYLLATQRLGTNKALVVEDSAAGLEAGRAAGLDVLHIPEASLMCELVRQRLNGMSEQPLSR